MLILSIIILARSLNISSKLLLTYSSPNLFKSTNSLIQKLITLGQGCGSLGMVLASMHKNLDFIISKGLTGVPLSQHLGGGSSSRFIFTYIVSFNASLSYITACLKISKLINSNHFFKTSPYPVSFIHLLSTVLSIKHFHLIVIILEDRVYHCILQIKETEAFRD